jgi:hypothetical protein
MLPPADGPAVVVPVAGAAGQPRRYHSGDYRVLVGELQHDAATNGWHLRYAAAGAGDAFGGVVRLAGFAPEAHGLRGGMTVLLQGEMAPAEAGTVGRDYRVTAFGVIGG